MRRAAGMGGLIVAAAVAGCATGDQAWPDSYILVNANVITMDPAQPRARAVIVEIRAEREFADCGAVARPNR